MSDLKGKIKGTFAGLSLVPMQKILLICLSSVLLQCSSAGRVSENPVVYQSGSLVIQSITSNIFLHTTFLQTTSFGEVPCNGVVFIKDGEAIVFDTPVNDSVSAELIDWIKDQKKADVKAVVPTHFHDDCLGGLAEFHKRRIPSYAHQLTINSAIEEEEEVPGHAFKNSLVLRAGGDSVIIDYLGAGHTPDNVVVYFPANEVMFGGCLIKEKGAKRGNLEHADTVAWPLTVSKLKNKYQDVQTVIPGHGTPGGKELLDYTIRLFQ